MPNEYQCAKCKDTGFLPFIKNSKVIPNVRIYCECHEINQPEYYQEARPEDYDFPMSYSYYRSLCQYHGWSDPGLCAPQNHNLEELHNRILVLEERPQPIYKSSVLHDTPRQKPEPKLYGGVKL